MKALLENKLVLHIVGEAIVFIAVIFYFSQRHKRVMNHINDLVQRIEEQEDMLHKHEKAIENLTKQLKELKDNTSTKPSVKGQSIPINKPVVVEPVFKTRPVKEVFIMETVIPKKEVVEVSDRVEEIIDENDAEEVVEEEVDDAELDKELAEELTELEATHNSNSANID